MTVFGDSAYADGATLDKLAEARHEVFAKVPPVRNSKGYSKDEFAINPAAGTIGCPAGHTAPLHPRRGGGGHAHFRPRCAGCPLRTTCTTARSGRVITIHPHEARLQQAKTAQRDPAWQQVNRATRPIAERKIAHFTRRPWGRTPGPLPRPSRILTDVLTRTAAINLANLAIRGLHFGPHGWVGLNTALRPTQPTNPDHVQGPERDQILPRLARRLRRISSLALHRRPPPDRTTQTSATSAPS